MLVDLTGCKLKVCLEPCMAEAMGRDTLLIGATGTAEQRFAAIDKRRINSCAPAKPATPHCACWTATSNDSNGGWRATGGNTGGYFIINDNGAGANGATDPSIQQQLSGLTVGETYVVTGDFTNFYNCCGAGTGSTALSFGVDIAPGGVLTQLAYPGSYPTWFSFSTSFTATQTAHTIRFSAERNGSDVEYAIDNISVLARSVPEPTSLALAGLALLGVAGLRKRQATR